MVKGKNKMKKQFLIFGLLFILLLVCGCNKTNDSDHSNSKDDTSQTEDTATYYTVTFDTQGGSQIDSVKVREGNPLRRPGNPKKDNYIFSGWYKSSDTNADEWDFDLDRVNKDTTLYASWLEDVPEATESITYERNSTGYTVTGAGQEEVIVIPDTYLDLPVTEIGESAFAYGAHTAEIKEITIPDSVTTIGLNAFYNRSTLVKVNISENSSLTTIGNNAFSGNTMLESIFIPKGVISIGDSAFNNCGALNNIVVDDANPKFSDDGNNLIDKDTKTLIRGTNHSTIPASVEMIAPAAFRRATTIEELFIPSTVTGIGNYFIADSSIKTIYYEGDETSFNSILASKRMWNYGNREVNVVYNSAR